MQSSISHIITITFSIRNHENSRYNEITGLGPRHDNILIRKKKKKVKQRRQQYNAQVQVHILSHPTPENATNTGQPQPLGYHSINWQHHVWHEVSSYSQNLLFPLLFFQCLLTILFSFNVVSNECEILFAIHVPPIGDFSHLPVNRYLFLITFKLD